MKYYIIAGEASGDLHGSNLIRALKNNDPNAEFRVWGGDLMEKQGAFLVNHYKNHSIMGFFPVLMHIKTIKRNFSLCENDIMNYSPDVIVLIDYSGFNLRIAKFVKQNLSIKVVYYISPQVWAWRQWRVHKIKRLVDKMIVILPFVRDFYEKHKMKVDYVGHPLLDEIQTYRLGHSFDEFISSHKLEKKPIVALLPGSRKHEIKSMLPQMLKQVEMFPDYQFVIGGVSSLPFDLYNQIISSYKVSIVFNKTYDLLNHAACAIVTSGTVSLEAALFKVPQVVVFKTDPVSAAIIRKLLKIKYVSIANLVMDKYIFQELLQENFTFKKLNNEIEKLLHDEKYINILQENYEKVKEKLGGVGASARAAQKIVQFTSNN